MYFEELRARLLENLRRRLHNGEHTERGLARLTGLSQSHMHNVLKGAKLLSPALGDQILRRLQITVLDLFDPAELDARCSGRPTERRPPGRAEPLPARTRQPAGPWHPSSG